MEGKLLTTANILVHKLCVVCCACMLAQCARNTTCALYAGILADSTDDHSFIATPLMNRVKEFSSEYLSAIRYYFTLPSYALHGRIIYAFTLFMLGVCPIQSLVSICISVLCGICV